MCIRPTFFAAVLATLVATPAFSQNAPPKIFISENPNLKTEKSIDTLTVRPNQASTYYVYISNPNDNERTYTLVVAKGDGPGDVLSKQTVEVGPTETVRVNLTAPVPPPVAPAVAGAPPAPPVDLAKATPNALTFRLLDKGGKKVGEELQRNIILQSPAGYIDETNNATTATFTKDGDKNRLEVVITKRKFTGNVVNPYAAGPCKVKLQLRADLIPGLIEDSVNDGTFEAELTQDGPDAITLTAENFKLADGNVVNTGLVVVSVDGVDRSLVFEVDFSGVNKTSQPLNATNPKLRIIPVSGKWMAVPGKPFLVRIEADPLLDNATINADFYRSGKSTADQSLLKKVNSRKVDISTLVGNSDGGITIRAVVGDHVVAIDTTNVVGKRDIEAKLITNTGLTRDDKKTLTLDRTPPVVGFVSAPAKEERGKVAKVSAVIYDRDSDLAGVIFFLGDAPGPDGKPSAGGKVIKGKRGSMADEWVAEVPLPDVKGRVSIGVRATNNVGLAKDGDAAEVDVVDPPAPPKEKEKDKFGIIKGLIAQGGGSQVRPQPGLKVQLKNIEGKVIKSTTTDDSGKFEFKEVEPGSYTVSSIKPADANAKGEKATSVEAGKTAEVTLFLLR